MMCGVLHIYDWCVDNNKQIQREAIQIQIAGEKLLIRQKINYSRQHENIILVVVVLN